MKIQLLTLFSAVSVLAATDVADGTARMPHPLNGQNFKQVLSKGLHLVEFFSPYCSHCKTLAPIWKSTWDAFHEDGKNLGISLVQVDCSESGDLCNEEKVLGYPSIRLYGPDGFIMNYPNYLRREQEDLIEFCKEIVFEVGDSKGNIKSKSELISTADMITILSDTKNKPILVSFWPSNDLTDLDNLNPDKFLTSHFEEALEFQRTWSIVSNQLDNVVQTGHFNCLSNKKICKQLEVPLDKPSVALIISRLDGKFIPYQSSPAAKDITDFAKRTLKNSEFAQVNVLSLLKHGYSTGPTRQMHALKPSTKTTFVFLYDEHTTTEDFDILPYLLEPLSKLPDAHLLTSNDTMLLKFVEMQHENAFRFGLREFNAKQFMVETITSYPTLLAFREFSLHSSVFHTYAPSDIRDQFVLKDWVNEHATPYLSELTSRTYDRIFKAPDKSEKVAVLLLSADNNDQALELLEDFHKVANYYENIRTIQNFNIFENERGFKNAEVQEMKKNPKATTRDIVRKLSKEIDLPDNGRITTVYLNLDKNRKLIDEWGWNIDQQKYEAGDVLIIDKNGPFYLNTNEKGERFELSKGTKVLAEIIAKSTKVYPGKVNNNLIGSPFSPRFRFLDSIHRYGFLGYLVPIIFVSSALIKLKRYIRKNRRTLGGKAKQNDGLGILGNPRYAKKD